MTCEDDGKGRCGLTGDALAGSEGVQRVVGGCAGVCLRRLVMMAAVERGLRSSASAFFFPFFSRTPRFDIGSAGHPSRPVMPRVRRAFLLLSERDGEQLRRGGTGDNPTACRRLSTLSGLAPGSESHARLRPVREPPSMCFSPSEDYLQYCLERSAFGHTFVHGVDNGISRKAPGSR